MNPEPAPRPTEAVALPDRRRADPRSPSLEALFFRQLQQVTTRIHDTDNLDQLMQLKGRVKGILVPTPSH